MMDNFQPLEWSFQLEKNMKLDILRVFKDIFRDRDGLSCFVEIFLFYAQSLLHLLDVPVLSIFLFFFFHLSTEYKIYQLHFQGRGRRAAILY